MKPSPLTRIAAGAADRSPGPAALAALADELRVAVGDEQVSAAEGARRAASTDFAHLSPILTGALPEKPADLVVHPRNVAELLAAVALAHRHLVPLTPRGAGTGNYGQAVPLAGGLVVDLSKCDRVLEIGDSWARVEAGATFVAVENAARQHGLELMMYPTTVGSTVGGFLAGGAGGVGSTEYGWLWDGFVLGLDVVTCPPGDGPLTVHGGLCKPYLHAYGVTGIIARALVRLVPARTWMGVFASFPAGNEAGAVAAGLAAMRLDPVPRLVSLDDPGLVALYPTDPALPPEKFSLRVIADISTVDGLRSIVAEHGGTVDDVRHNGAAYVSSLGFNHVTLRARKARPDLCHLQVSGEALVTAPDEVRAALPGGLLHRDGLRLHLDPDDPAAGRRYGGLLLSEYQDVETFYEGVTRLEELGVFVVDPHTWLLGGPSLPAIRETALRNDPDALLNPGKLPD